MQWGRILLVPPPFPPRSQISIWERTCLQSSAFSGPRGSKASGTSTFPNGNLGTRGRGAGATVPRGTFSRCLIRAHSPPPRPPCSNARIAPPKLFHVEQFIFCVRYSAFRCGLLPIGTGLCIPREKKPPGATERPSPACPCLRASLPDQCLATHTSAFGSIGTSVR